LSVLAGDPGFIFAGPEKMAEVGPNADRKAGKSRGVVNNGPFPNFGTAFDL
jgi:hypothetical protein